MKRLMFDLYVAQNNARKSGGNEYIYTVLKKLLEYHGKEIELIPCYDFNADIEDWVKELLDKYDVKPCDVKNRKMITEMCEKENIDIFYTGLPYVYYDAHRKETKFVGTFHGIRDYERSNDMLTYINSGSRFQMLEKHVVPYALINMKMAMRSESMKKGYIKALQNFDAVITDSDHSKYALKSLWGGISSKINVFYAPEKQRKLCENVSDGRYILLTMCERPEKNVYRALVAIDRLQKTGLIPDIKTKVTGLASKELKAEFASNPMIELMDKYVSMEELEKLYAECTLFVFPSLNEGFGYPPLEAMSYGKTCVVGADTSLTEIGGDAVYYANPFDIFEIQTRILQAIENPKDSEYVKERCRKVNQKQQEDLRKLCDFIVNL